MALGTSKTKLLVWAVALLLQQVRQCANSSAEQATVLHGWSLRLNGTEQMHQNSCPSLEYVVAPRSLNIAARHRRDRMGMRDQGLCFLCNLSCHDAVNTKDLGGRKLDRAIVFVMIRRGYREGETRRGPYMSDSTFYFLIPLKIIVLKRIACFPQFWKRPLEPWDPSVRLGSEPLCQGSPVSLPHACLCMSVIQVRVLH